MTVPKLIECPFCGNAPRYLEAKAGFYTERVICDHCHFHLEETATQTAVERWNTRSPEESKHQRDRTDSSIYGAKVVQEGNRDVLTFWPHCDRCKSPFQFEPDEPFAHCGCAGSTEWGDPRPASWVQPPASLNAEYSSLVKTRDSALKLFSALITDRIDVGDWPPTATKAIQDLGAAPAMGYEHQCAIMEDERRASLDAFDPDASLTRTEERLYETAFTNGWDRAMRAAQPAGAQQTGTAGLVGALEDAQRAINSMKVEAETAAQGDEQMMLEACETISNEGLQAGMAIRAALASHGKAPAQAAAPAHAGEYPALVCDYCGALTPDPWHSSGMLHGKMSKHIHSCDACWRGAAQPAPVRGTPADLPPLPDPDLRDVGTTPGGIKEFLRGYATEYAKAALAARAPADSVTAPAGGEIDRLRAALVYVAFALHGKPQYMLAEGIALIDGDTVRVSRDGWTVEASINPVRATPPAQAADSVLEDAARYRFLAGHCRSTSEHWGGRWSIVVDGPAPKSHDSEDDFDEAVDAALAAQRGNK